MLRVEDHAQSGAVFHAAAGIQELKLGIDVGPVWPSESAQMQHRRLSHQLDNALGNPQRPVPDLKCA